MLCFLQSFGEFFQCHWMPGVDSQEVYEWPGILLPDRPRTEVIVWHLDLKIAFATLTKAMSPVAMQWLARRWSVFYKILLSTFIIGEESMAEDHCLVNVECRAYQLMCFSESISGGLEPGSSTPPFKDNQRWPYYWSYQ